MTPPTNLITEVLESLSAETHMTCIDGIIVLSVTKNNVSG